MTLQERKLVDQALQLINGRFVSGNSRRLGSIGEFDLIQAIKKLEQAIELDDPSGDLANEQ